MKKFIWILLGAVLVILPLFSFANLTVSQQATVDTAADQIVDIMEKQDISMTEFMSILETFEARLQWDERKLMILEALRNATLDSYYGVENFAMCESYNDGCNTCMVTDDYEIACTKRACVQQLEPTCLQYEGEIIDNWQDPVSFQEIECENAWGQFNRLYNECEDIDALTCNSLWWMFDECASACRHEPEGSICTMQCVVVCDFNGWGEEQALLDAQMELDNAIMIRESQEITEYTLAQQHSCFCPREYTRPVTYMVQNRSVNTSTATYADEDMQPLDPDMSPELLTVGWAFDLIQDAIDQKAASITVSYDDTLWYPTNISIDYSEMMADEEAYYTFSIQ